MWLMDFLDNFIFGPLNLINRLEGLVRLGYYQDSGVRFALLRLDKGGTHTLPEVRSLLHRYGIVLFGCTHDAQCIYFTVKKRQATWAEYLLLHAGVELKNPPVDPRNAHHVANHPPGWMPPAWVDQGQGQAEGEGEQRQQQPQSPSSIWRKMDAMLDDWLKK